MVRIPSTSSPALMRRNTSDGYSNGVVNSPISLRSVSEEGPVVTPRRTESPAITSSGLTTTVVTPVLLPRATSSGSFLDRIRRRRTNTSTSQNSATTSDDAAGSPRLYELS